MSLEALTPKEKKAITETLTHLNQKYGGEGTTIKQIRWATKTVLLEGGRTPSRVFELKNGKRPNTFGVKFAGQVGTAKMPPPAPRGRKARVLA